MIAYKRIVVPVDGSENAKRALEHACALAVAADASLILLYVATIISSTPSFGSLFGGYAAERVAVELQEKGERILQEAAASVPHRVKVERVFEVGAPDAIILSVVKEKAGDMIVMGCRGLGKVEGYALGSVSQYVMNHANVPVILVK